ncbi:MAG TPA: DUF6279 family lipoprotein [Pseudomonas sp.]|nr:DUF6279 family lipoprotein [Pseudomonas sp.]
MSPRRLQQTLLLVLGFSLVLSACNRIGLAYRHLDALVPWWVDGYVELDHQQKRWFDQRLAEHLDWHCRTQLPTYIDWLDQADRVLQSGQTDSAQVAEQLAALSDAQQRVAQQVSPTLVELLRGLDPRQVADLQASVEEKHQELREKYLAPVLPEQIRQRQLRLEKRLSPWLGELNPQQLARIRAWSVAQGEQNRLWLEDRARWQAELFAALEQRHSAAFAPQVRRLLQQPETLRDTTYREAFERSQQALVALLGDLLSSAEPDQRRHLRNRLREVREEFSEQRCTTA